jgi:hypothetical protein
MEFNQPLSKFDNKKLISDNSRAADHDQTVILILKEVVAEH